jgi:hypothetical protein
MNYHPSVIFWLVFGALSFLIVYLDRKNNLLRDTSEARPRPYSFSRMQLTWWTVIVLAAFITILIVKKVCPTLWESTLILIGISSATMTTARVIDAADQSNTGVSRHQDERSNNLIIDILSDEKGVSIHRLQTVLFNITFGVWFIIIVIKGLNDATVDADHVMPQIEANNLVLLGLSSALYAGLKATENKQPEKPVQPEQVPDEAGLNQSDALG